ncbi:MAG: hypothetical protein WBD40_24820, partial [Tepidisphaeraceae bacterium]
MSTPPPATIRQSVESLERRRHFAAQVVDRVLIVTGTEGVDEIVMTRAEAAPNLSVTINGVEQIIAVSTFDSTRIECLGGNDVVDATNLAGLPVTVLGGLGNDRIGTCQGGDSIEGGEGLDTIVANDGDDTVLGGAGSD